MGNTLRLAGTRSLEAAEKLSDDLDLIISEILGERGDDLAGEEGEEFIDSVGAFVGDGDQHAAGIVWVRTSCEDFLCFQPVEEGLQRLGTAGECGAS